MSYIKKYLNFIYIFIILILSFLIIKPYFHSGYFPTHDGIWAVVRTSEMFRELKDFQFPPRMSEFLNFGYGYPLFNFDYPFPYYLTFIFHVFRLSFINSTKLVFALTVPVSMLFMYFSVEKLFKNKTAGLIASIFYGFYPYRLVDLYARGSIGESMGFMLFPILFFIALKIKENTKNKIYPVLFGASFAALVVSHNIMTVLFAPIIFIICLIFYLETKNKKILINYILGFLFGIGLSFYFFAPALYEEHLIRLSIIPIADRNLYYSTIKQLIMPAWGYGIPGAKDSFSYQIGFPQLIIFLIGILIVIFNFLSRHSGLSRIRSWMRFAYQDDVWNIFLFSIIYSIFIILLQFKFSGIFWEHTPLFKVINYPWTYLAPLGFLLALISGFVYSTKNKIFKITTIIICLIAVIYYAPFVKPQYYTNYPDSYYFTNDATTTSSSEVMPLWVKTLPLQMPAEKVLLSSGSGTINNVLYNSKKITFNVNINSSNAIVRINQIYYPGWGILVDNKKMDINYKNQFGVMDIKINNGAHTIVANFKETTFRLIADLVSVVSFIIGMIIVIFNFKRRDSE